MENQVRTTNNRVIVSSFFRSTIFSTARRRIALSVCVLSMMLLAALALRHPTDGTPSAASHQPDLEKMPISFEPNVGQTDPSVRFLAHAPGGMLYFTPSEIVLVLRQENRAGAEKAAYVKPDLSKPDPAPTSDAVRLRFEGANPKSSLESSEALPGKVNYFIGNDPAKWHTDLSTSGTVTYRQLYPGIDLSYSGTSRLLKGTYLVAPNISPDVIRWHYEGAKAVGVQADGSLQIQLPARDGSEASTLTEQAPVAWQEINGQKIEVTIGYAIHDSIVGFALGQYDHKYPLTIDPVLVYSTYLGGSSDDWGNAIAVDPGGYFYVTGQTMSPDFPLQSPLNPPSLTSRTDVFVTKFSVSGSTLVYSTYLGGHDINNTAGEEGTAIAWGNDGNGFIAYVAGVTDAPDFPTTPGAFQEHNNGGNRGTDAFVTKLSPSGSSLMYSTCLGGSGPGLGGDDTALGIAVSGGYAYVVGVTSAEDFPLRYAYDPDPPAGRPVAGKGFVTKFNLSGSDLEYSTYLGGVDTDLQTSTAGTCTAVAVDASGYAYVTGITYTYDFPTHLAIQPNYGLNGDAFVTKFDPAGNTVAYSTYLGGASADVGYGIASDNLGNAYIVDKLHNNRAM